MRCVALFAYAVSILVLWIKLCRSQNTDTCFTTSLVLVDADTLNYTRAIGSSVTYSVDSYISTVCRQLTWQFNSVPVVFYRSGSLTYGGDYNSSSLQLVLNATGTNELFHFELTILSLSARENNLNVVVTNAASSDSVATPLIATYCPVDNRTNSYTPTQTTCGFNCVATFQCNNDTFEVTGYAGQNNYTESCQANATLTNDGSCTEKTCQVSIAANPTGVCLSSGSPNSTVNIGSTVVIQCCPGWSGNSSIRSCVDSDVWNGTVSCQIETCKIYLANSTVGVCLSSASPISSVNVTTSVAVECCPGWSGNSVNRTCVASDTWDGTISCQLVNQVIVSTDPSTNTTVSTTSPNDIVVTESKSGSYTNVGAIVGGVIGGVALLGLIGGGVFLYKKHSGVSSTKGHKSTANNDNL